MILKPSRKNIVERVINKVKNKTIYSTNKLRKKTLNNKNFTIISNNCWGGRIYKSFGLPYNSPTVGLSIMSDDYIIFLKNLKGFLESDVIFVDLYSSKWKQYYIETNRLINYPIGQIFYDGECVELSFINYKSEEEAREKWNRRKNRVDFSNMLVKISEQNDFSEKTLDDFIDLDYKNKICFVNSDYSGENIYRTAIYSGDMDIEDEPKLHIGNEKTVNILNKL